MKRIFVSLFLIIILLFGIMAEAENRFTISEIYEQYNGQRWQETYQTVRNETVMIDAPFIIPNVESAPVIRVGNYPALDSIVYDVYGKYPRSLRKHVDAWARSDGRDITLAMHQYWEFEIPDKYAGKSNFGEEVFLPDEIDWNLHAENNDMIMGEAYELLTAKLNEILTAFGSGAIEMQLRDAYTLGLYRNEDNQPLIDHRGYGFDFKQVIRGIPALGNAHLTYQHGRMRTNHRWEGVYDNWINLEMSSPVSYSMSAKLWKEEECLNEDIPLVPFDAGKAVIEQMIKDGLIRHIRRIQLGYVAYVEPDHNTKHWILVPTWVVDCDWFPDAKDDFWEEEYEDEMNPYKRSGAHLIYINAQTGKLLDPMDTSRNRSDAPKILTWK